ncbi:MAG: peptidase M50 [Chloroflexi bacterium]|nr:MAG: peptidase M50 [Chloroflexota bacterium]RLC92360.1 MAG: peptidase M50 [Chloroflexota bacterium]
MSGVKLFTVRGIAVKMHVTFPLILVWAAVQFGYLNQRGFSLSGAAFGIVITLLLFICVVIHELAHSLTATAMGFPVRDIVLLPLGGIAQMERMPERPGQEFLMAIAGPLSNVVIAVLLVVGGLLFGLDVRPRMDLARLGWKDTLPYLIATNLGLAVFNLIPAFPMDGGRVLRALLATVMPHARATALAVSVGQGLAWMLGLMGLLSGNFLWILIAFFVYAGAAQEGQLIHVKNVLQGLRVRQAFSRHALSLSPDDPVSRATDLTLESFQADFPVCDAEQLVGLLTHTDVLRALKQRRPDTPVREVMRTKFPTIGLDDGLFEAHRQMTEAGLDALPVMEGEQFLGLLTRRDVNEVYQLLSVSPELLTQRRGV